MPEIYTYDEKPKPRSGIIKYVINENGCWECVSHKRKGANGNGYFQVLRNGIRSLHRYIYELEKGKIPEGMHIRHSCDNRICFNPTHLSIGTHLDNMRDMVLRNRSSDRSGEKNQCAKLKEHDIPIIRADTRSTKEIATSYGISNSQVYRIRKRQRWVEVK